MGGDLDFYNSYAQRGNLPKIEEVVAACTALFPSFGRLRLMRTWGGIMDMTMDGSPIIGKLPVKGLYMTGGWCYGGFKATPASGWVHAWTIAHDEPHPLNAAFTLERFRRRPHDRRKGRGPLSVGALSGWRDAAHDARFPARGAGRATRSSSRTAAMRRCGVPRPMRRKRHGSIMSTCATTRAGRMTSCGITARVAAAGSRFAAIRARTRSSPARRPISRCRTIHRRAPPPPGPNRSMGIGRDAAVATAIGRRDRSLASARLRIRRHALRGLRRRHARLGAARQRRASRRRAASSITGRAASTAPAPRSRTRWCSSRAAHAPSRTPVPRRSSCTTA